jgi:Yip1-like protein
MAAMPVPSASDPVTESVPLSEPARVLNTFFAPSKTFTDLRRSASWWLPFLITAIVSIAFVYVVDQKVGFRKVVENQIRTQPKQADRIDRMPADQREKTLQQQTVGTKYFSYGFWLFLLAWSAIVAAVLLATLKFGLSADVKFKTLFALVIFAGLPGLLKALLAMVSLLAGVSGDSFTFQNPVATNPGYFIDPTASPVLHSLLTSLDVVTIWTLVLTAIGITCISKVKSGTAYAVVFGWYAVVVLIGVIFASFA